MLDLTLRDKPRVVILGKERPAKVISLMYHDVVDQHGGKLSGFTGRHAAIYKLSQNDFALHLNMIRRNTSAKSEGGGGTADGKSVLLTFDDGGASAYDPIASMLEQHGWRAHFFITTDWIGRPGFLTADQIRELDIRGHVIGSHSCSHPTRMSHISSERLLAEWSASTQRLAKIVNHPVTAASVPGGYYSRRVAEAAVEAGIETLFTSEPTTKVRVLGGCRVLGRYTIRQTTGPECAGALAAGRWGPQLQQALLWKAKKAAKIMAGSTYLWVQGCVFSTHQD